MSRQACAVQCAQCPFRPTSLRGWLGSYTFPGIFQAAWFNQPFYCHSKIDYEDPRWERKAKQSGRICLGYLAFANAICAPKRVDDRADLADTVADQELIIRLRAAVEGRTDVAAMGAIAFRDHHNRQPASV